MSNFLSISSIPSTTTYSELSSSSFQSSPHKAPGAVVNYLLSDFNKENLYACMTNQIPLDERLSMAAQKLDLSLQKCKELWNQHGAELAKNTALIRKYGLLPQEWSEKEFEDLLEYMLEDPSEKKLEEFAKKSTSMTLEECKNMWDKRVYFTQKFLKIRTENASFIEWSHEDLKELRKLRDLPIGDLGRLRAAKERIKRPLIECYAKIITLFEQPKKTTISPPDSTPLSVPAADVASSTSSKSLNQTSHFNKQWTDKEKRILYKYMAKVSNDSQYTNDMRFKDASLKLPERSKLACKNAWHFYGDELKSDPALIEEFGRIVKVNKEWTAEHKKILYKNMVFKDFVNANYQRAAQELGTSFSAVRNAWCNFRAELQADEDLNKEFGAIQSKPIPMDAQRYSSKRPFPEISQEEADAELSQTTRYSTKKRCYHNISQEDINAELAENDETSEDGSVEVSDSLKPCDTKPNEWSEQELEVIYEEMSYKGPIRFNLKMASDRLVDRSLIACISCWKNRKDELVKNIDYKNKYGLLGSNERFGPLLKSAYVPKKRKFTDAIKEKRCKKWFPHEYEVLYEEMTYIGQKKINFKSASKRLISKTREACEKIWNYHYEKMFANNSDLQSKYGLLNSKQRPDTTVATTSLLIESQNVAASDLATQIPIPAQADLPNVNLGINYGFTPLGDNSLWQDEAFETLVRCMLTPAKDQSNLDMVEQTNVAMAVLILQTRSIEQCQNAWNGRVGHLVQYMSSLVTQADYRPWSVEHNRMFDEMLSASELVGEALQAISQQLNRPFLECFAKWELMKEDRKNTLPQETPQTTTLSTSQFQEMSGLDVLAAAAMENGSK